MDWLHGNLRAWGRGVGKGGRGGGRGGGERQTDRQTERERERERERESDRQRQRQRKTQTDRRDRHRQTDNHYTPTLPPPQHTHTHTHTNTQTFKQFYLPLSLPPYLQTNEEKQSPSYPITFSPKLVLSWVFGTSTNSVCTQTILSYRKGHLLSGLVGSIICAQMDWLHRH